MTEIFVKYNALETNFRELEEYVGSERNKSLCMCDVSLNFDQNNENKKIGKAKIRLRYRTGDWLLEEKVMDGLIARLINRKEVHITLLRECA